MKRITSPSRGDMGHCSQCDGFSFLLSGEFLMGTEAPDCPEDDPFTEKNEREDCLASVPLRETPRHKVIISQPFYMGKYEVTQLQWYQVMGNNPAYFKTEKAGMDSRHHPVERVSWEDVQEFVRKLNEKEGTNAYRLPTEAEWEYAARAGTQTTYSFGDDTSKLGEYAWYKKNSGDKTHPVGQLKPNAWGLYDMHGNVWEWCQDLYGEDYYTNSPEKDPLGPVSGSSRVGRGGSWFFPAWFVRSAYRGGYDPGDRRNDVGFRLLRTL